MKENIKSMPFKLRRSDRAKHYGHLGGVIWFTGLSGSGKSTLAISLEQELMRLGYSCYVLDGDNLRSGLNASLGFSQEDRSENIRRVAEVSALFSGAGLICISALISPCRVDRALARKICGDNFFEVYVSTELAVCESRDVKGLYKKARAGQIPDFTGVSAPYEAPELPDFKVDTNSEGLDECIERFVRFVAEKFPLTKS